MNRSLFASILSLLSSVAVSQLPTIHAHTLIPASPSGSAHVKIVTHLETPNAAFLVDKTFSVIASSKTIRLHLCYAQSMPTVISHHIDTFALGQLSPGTYSVKLDAYLSSAGQHCARIDSNFASSTFTVAQTTQLKDGYLPGQISVYPNPAQDYVMIAPPEKRTVQIFSCLGELVRSAETSSQGRLPLHGLPAGVYLVRVSSSAGNEVHRIVIN